MWRGAITPALIVGIIGIGVSGATRGRAGFLGGLIGFITVFIFFSVHLLVARVTRNADPMSTMAIAMFSYFAKIMVMGGFLIAITKLTSPESIDRTSFGLSAIAITAAWLGGEIRAFLKIRFQLPLPNGE